jgi:AraC-like DNA-binding protein
MAHYARPGDVDAMIAFDIRSSDSPFVERVWRARSERPGSFHSVAQSSVEMVVSRVGGRTSFTLRGPETRVSQADLPAEGEWMGIRFAVGTFLPRFVPSSLADRRDATLPEASTRAFWLDGSAWEHPDFENADTFVARLIARGLLVHDPCVADAVRGRAASTTSPRTVQRRCLTAAGLTCGAIRQIERARYATLLLRDGVSILDAVDRAGYYDQAHLTRSLRHRVGLTPAAVARGAAQLSLLYKTPFWP